VKLSLWPSTGLPTLSIVQDPLESITTPQTFAQPIVFFRLEPIGRFACSPLASTLTSLRLRLPRRQVVKHMLPAPNALPALLHLDLSTCRIDHNDVGILIMRLPNLHTLTLDGCGTVHGGGEQAGEEWFALGRAVALAGHVRARNREKEIRAYYEKLVAEEKEKNVVNTNIAPVPASRAKKAKKGRKGVATSTISLRDKPGASTSSQPRAQPVPSPATIGSKQDVEDEENSIDMAKLARVRILPFVAALQSIATTPSAHIPVSAYDTIRSEFERGWTEGITTLNAVRKRLRGSRATPLMRYARPGEQEYGRESEFALEGLVDVKDAEMEELQEGPWTLPTLCLAGPDKEGAHVDNCPHLRGWKVFDDGLV
jgi:hypothetical protein